MNSEFVKSISEANTITTAIGRTYNGSKYCLPPGLPSDKAKTIIEELIEIIKQKNLSTRQAQCVFEICADKILDYTFRGVDTY